MESGDTQDVSGARRGRPGGAEGSGAGSGPAAGVMEPGSALRQPSGHLCSGFSGCRVLGAGGGELSQGGFLCRGS